MGDREAHASAEALGAGRDRARDGAGSAYGKSPSGELTRINEPASLRDSDQRHLNGEDVGWWPDLLECSEPCSQIISTSSAC